MAFERRQYSGSAPQTTLASSITNADTTILVANGAGYPDGSTGPFFIVIDPDQASEEHIKCSGRSSNTITALARGSDSTTAASHSAGVVVRHNFAAVDADEANAHYSNTGYDHHTQYLNTARHDVTARHPTAVIADGAITTVKLAASAVTANELAANAVTTAKILDANVTFAKYEAAAVSRWSRGTTQTIADATEATIQWTTEVEDDLSMAAPNFTIITMPAGSGGWWGADFSVTVNGSLGASGYLQLVINNTVGYRIVGGVVASGAWGATWGVYLLSGDTVEFRAANFSGSSRDVTAANLRMCRIGKTS